MALDSLVISNGLFFLGAALLPFYTRISSNRARRLLFPHPIPPARIYIILPVASIACRHKEVKLQGSHLSAQVPKLSCSEMDQGVRNMELGIHYGQPVLSLRRTNPFVRG